MNSPQLARQGNRTECDVVVIGSGAGGMAAALTARLAGLDVVVLEKANVLGGATAMSGGGIWIPLSPHAIAAGVNDSRENVLLYFKSALGNHYDVERAEAFVDSGPKMLELLEHNTSVKFDLGAAPDHHSEIPGAMERGRQVVPRSIDGHALGPAIARLRLPKPETTFLGMIVAASEASLFYNVFRSRKATWHVTKRIVGQIRDYVLYGRTMKLANGNALAGRLVKSAVDLGIPLHTSFEATKLIMADGRVAGVEGLSPQGRKKYFARRGVVLATGGMAHDQKRKQEVYEHAKAGGPHYSILASSDTGDGIRMAEEVDAKFSTDLVHPAAWLPVSLLPSKSTVPRTVHHIMERSKPGFIVVNRQGERFCNETDCYQDFGAAVAKTCAGEKETYCFLIADHRTIRRYGIGTVRPAPLPLWPFLRSGYLMKGNTLHELAERVGIDPEPFVVSIKEFNRGAVKGEDPQFGRGSTFYSRALGDPTHKPNPCVGPIDRGPFYAVKMYMGDTGTFAGLATDANARVLNSKAQPIPGLYAAGNDMHHVMGGIYLGGGSTLGPAMTYGYIAGRHLAGEVGPD